MPEVAGKRPLRWRIAEAFEGPRGWLLICAITVVVLAAIIVPYMFKPFVGRPEIRRDDFIEQTEVRCDAPFTEVRRSVDVNNPSNERQLCVDHGRTRIFVAGGASLFVLIFAGIALLSRAGRLQPKELAR